MTGVQTPAREARARRLVPAGGPRSSALPALLLLAACGYLLLEPWHGLIVLTLSEEHGVDAADLPALVLIAIAVAHARPGRRVAGRAVAAAAIALGAALVAGMLAPRIGAPLVPTGGGTFGGSTVQVSGVRAEPVGHWTHLAVTYDGTTVRLYVDGAEASSRSLSGNLRRTTDPLWIGGNRPYGEYFRGVIDEVRVYDRALSPAQLRAALSTPIEGHGQRAAGLVAAYAFDGPGRTAADASGHGNAGTIRRASWTRAGHFGGGMSFEADGEVVRVPASDSLDLRGAMTLAAWIKPSEPQSGWRTVVARQTDAYTLMAGGGRQNAGRLEVLDTLRFMLVLLLAAWIGWAVARGHSLWAPGGRRWYWPIALFVGGSLVDVALTPSNAVIGPALVAAWWGATSSDRGERIAMGALAAVFAAVTVLSVADPTTALLPFDNGGVVRSAALGLLLVAAGILSVPRKTGPGRPVGVT